VSAGIGGDELRLLVREVLAELLPAGVKGSLSAADPAAGGGGTEVALAQPGAGTRVAPTQLGAVHNVNEPVESVEMVSLRSDTELDAFVRRLLKLFENPKHRDALRSGRLRFRLAASAAPGSVQPTNRVEKGAVTESMVREAARAGARLVLGRRAVLTPLARDRARAAGVEIERER
jgi:hypothetical protein